MHVCVCMHAHTDLLIGVLQNYYLHTNIVYILVQFYNESNKITAVIIWDN